jgi:hypothetical protein
MMRARRDLSTIKAGLELIEKLLATYTAKAEED